MIRDGVHDQMCWSELPQDRPWQYNPYLVPDYSPTFLLRPFGAYRNLIPMAKNTVPREALLALTNMRAAQSRKKSPALAPR